MAPGAPSSISPARSARRATTSSLSRPESPEGEFGNYPHYLSQLAAAGVPCWLEDSLFVRDAACHARVVSRLKAELGRTDIEVIHAHAGEPARIGLAVAAQRTHPVVVVQTQHGWGTNKTAGQAREDVETLRAVAAVLVTSEGTRVQLASLGVPRPSITVVPCGLDPAAPPPSRVALEAAARFRAQGRVVLGCVGSVTANKNQEAVLCALARSAGQRLAAVIVGEGGERLEAVCRDAGVEQAVCLAGFRADADAWLPTFDFLIVPSFTEGQGLVVLEAFRAGVPVIASDIAPLRELVEEGRTGWLCDPRDPQSIVGAVARASSISTERHQEILAAARAVFDRDYTTAAMLRRHDTAYANAVEQLQFVNCEL